MRRWRQHLVGLVALFFALTVGIALGGGPLSQGSDATPVSTEQESSPPSAAPDPRAAYADTFAQSVAARAYAGGLTARSVALVVLPGVDMATVDDLVAQIAAAGGSVTATYAVQQPWLDPAEKSLVDTLGSQLAQQLTEIQVSPDATAYDRVGALLGAAVATTKGKPDVVSTESPTILQSLEGAGLLASSAVAQSRAPLVLVVLGTDPGPDSDPVVEGLLTGLAGTARGVVVAGDSASPGGDGVLARLRRSSVAPSITTVDGVDGPAGRVTATLALVRAMSTPGGSFGASGADGAVPLG